MYIGYYCNSASKPQFKKSKNKFSYFYCYLISKPHNIPKANKYLKQDPYIWYRPHTFLFLAVCSDCSFTSIQILSVLVLLQELFQRKALLSSRLASLRLKGWWKFLRMLLVAGSMGPRLRSSSRRVLDIGCLVSAASTCCDTGPTGKVKQCIINQRKCILFHLQRESHSD